MGYTKEHFAEAVNKAFSEHGPGLRITKVEIDGYKAIPYFKSNSGKQEWPSEIIFNGEDFAFSVVGFYPGSTGPAAFANYIKEELKAL